MNDLTNFILARITEDEHRLDLPEFEEAVSYRGPGWGNRGDCPICGVYQFDGTEVVTEEAWWAHAEHAHQRYRGLKECEAKRRLIRWYGDGEDFGDGGQFLEILAMPYSDHPDYRDEWRPDTPTNAA
jgi:hypothetical protein